MEGILRMLLSSLLEMEFDGSTGFRVHLELDAWACIYVVSEVWFLT